MDDMIFFRKQLSEMQDVRYDRDLIKSQYEKLTQDFENKVTPLQEEIMQLKAHKSTINDESASSIKGKADMEAELEDTKKRHKELKSIIELLTSELNETKDQMKHIETEKQNLNDESQNQLKDSKVEIEQLKSKLNLTLNNAKQLEKEVRIHLSILIPTSFFSFLVY